MKNITIGLLLVAVTILLFTNCRQGTTNSDQTSPDSVAPFEITCTDSAINLDSFYESLKCNYSIEYYSGLIEASDSTDCSLTLIDTLQITKGILSSIVVNKFHTTLSFSDYLDNEIQGLKSDLSILERQPFKLNDENAYLIMAEETTANSDTFINAYSYISDNEIVYLIHYSTIKYENYKKRLCTFRHLLSSFKFKGNLETRAI